MLNKVDKVAKPKLLTLIERYQALHEFAAYIPISAMKGEGLDVLRKEIVERLPAGPSLFPEDYVTDQPERFLAAEILREKILAPDASGSSARHRGDGGFLGRQRHV